MKIEDCNEIYKLIEDNLSDTLYVINYDYYLWVYYKSNDNMGMVIHGGENNNPYSMELIKAENNLNVSKKFNSLREIKLYIKNKLLDDIMIYSL